MTPPLEGPSATTPTEIPPAVVELAAQRQLGELRAAHGDPNPFVLLALAALLAGASIGLWEFMNRTELGIRALAFLGLFGVVFAFVMTCFAIRIMLTGARQAHLFANGFVARRRRRLRAATWTEVDQIVRNVQGDTLASYTVLLRDGTKVDLRVGRIKKTAATFEAAAEQLISQYGIVTERELLAEALRKMEAAGELEGTDWAADPGPGRG